MTIRPCFAEALESRTLLTTLPAGFHETLVAQLSADLTPSMAIAPDGRVFIADSRAGSVRVVKNGKVLSTPFCVVKVDKYRERGMTGVALDPDFAHNGFVYVYYTKADPKNPNTTPNNSSNTLSRFKAKSGNPDVADSGFGEQVLIGGIPSFTGVHNGGFLHFGKDKMLYLGIGDFAASSTRVTDLADYSGKLLRLDVAKYPNLVPAENPFVSKPGAIGTIYALGLRNPFSGDIDPVTGRIFVNDVGNKGFEEIDQISPGGNYGWPTGDGKLGKSGLIDPLYAYSHNGKSAAITGGAFYNASQFPSSFKGKYFFADEVNRFIRVLDPATKTASNFAGSTAPIVDLDVAPDGSLYALDLDGHLYKYTYNGGSNRAPTAVASADKTDGALPLKVNFTGAGSSDPDGDSLTYTWNFGDGQSATGKTISHTFTKSGRFGARLTVSDGHGGSSTSLPIEITAGNSSPKPVISLPTAGAKFTAGDTIQFSGSATDADDPSLPASAFHWSIVFHHADHTHPFIDAIDGVKSGSFKIPTTGETDPDQWYRVQLTVTDSGGLSKDAFTDVFPRTSTFTLASNITGAQLTLDGAPRATPASTKGVAGMVRTIAAPKSFDLNGKSYQFVNWSDGGAATHDISTPASNKTFTATFKALNSANTTLSPTADAYVRDGENAATNYGAEESLVVKKASTGFNRETYLKFDLSAVAKINSAKLRLFGSLSDVTAHNIVTSIFGASDTSWLEDSITYKTRPATTGSAVASATITDAIGRWYEFDVTSYLKAQKSAGKSQVTLVLKNQGTASLVTSFNSSEAITNRPQLVIG